MEPNDVIDGSFVERTIEHMARSSPDGFLRSLAILEDKSSGRHRRQTARHGILHDIGNMVVISMAGLEHAIPDRLKEDYGKSLHSFMECRKALVKNSFEIPPQIDEAFALLKNPELDY